jgi:hypothetical protein
MAKTRAFVSFDYDHDSFLKEAIIGQSKHPDTPFDLADHSIKEAISGNWQAKARMRIQGVDVVIVICGEHTHTASGVSAELAIAQALGKPYFLLWGYSGKTCTKPLAALATDKVYDWTWPNLKALIGGAR